jgi:hypothetical protein
MGRLYSGEKARDFGGNDDPGLVEPVRERLFEVELGAVVGTSIWRMNEVGVRAMIIFQSTIRPRAQIGFQRRRGTLRSQREWMQDHHNPGPKEHLDVDLRRSVTC